MNNFSNNHQMKVANSQNVHKNNYSESVNSATQVKKPNATNSENSYQSTRASPTLKDRYNSILTSLKNNNKKTIKVAVLVIILCVMVVLYFNISLLDKPQSSEKKVNYTYTTSLEYARSLESKLENLLSKIKGAKEAKVMIYLDGSLELILAERVDEKNNSTTSGSNSNSYITTVTEPIILTNGSMSVPLVLTEKLPTIKGIVVVCKGASDVMVKMDIINAIRTLFNLPHANIEVFAGS